jgi:predicted XRE-type DNA-binding protein
MAKKIETVEVGTGDVFRDLGFADAGEQKLRVQFAMRVNDLIKDRKLTRFSFERLLHFITLLDRDVEIVIRPKAENHASGLVSVLVAA